MRHTRTCIVLFVILFLLSCSPVSERELSKAQKLIRVGDYDRALERLWLIIQRFPNSPIAVDAAREGARVAKYEIKDPAKSIPFLQTIVLKSDNAQERRQAQEELARVYFEGTQQYELAIGEYQKLISTAKEPSERGVFRLAMAKAAFHMGDFRQAKSEIEKMLTETSDEELIFQGKRLLGNTLVSLKDHTAAIRIFENLIQKYPEASKKENIVLLLSVCYEEKAAFKDAIAVLEKYPSDSSQTDYIAMRIKRLQQRIKNQPGAKGFRK